MIIASVFLSKTATVVRFGLQIVAISCNSCFIVKWFCLNKVPNSAGLRLEKMGRYLLGMFIYGSTPPPLCGSILGVYLVQPMSRSMSHTPHCARNYVCTIY